MKLRTFKKLVDSCFDKANGRDVDLYLFAIDESGADHWLTPLDVSTYDVTKDARIRFRIELDDEDL